MAQAFRDCGAEIVCFDRATGDPRDLVRDSLFGSRMPWRSQVLAPGVDAIVCCAPPEVTTEVARYAWERAGKRVCASKPLRWEWPDSKLISPNTSGIYVDLWRLYSPAWRALKQDLTGREISAAHVDFYGNGPVRATHSGLLDYGPHALAFVLDLGLKPELTWTEHAPNCWTGEAENVGVVTGNGFRSPMMYVRVETTDGVQYIWHERDQMQTYEAGGAILLQNWRDLALRSFCRGFLAGDESDTLRISCEAIRLLAQAPT